MKQVKRIAAAPSTLGKEPEWEAGWPSGNLGLERRTLDDHDDLRVPPA